MIVISLVVQQGRSQRMGQTAVCRQPSNTGSCKRRGLSPDSLCDSLCVVWCEACWQ